MTPLYRELRFHSPDGLPLFCREYSCAAPRGDVICLPGLTRNSMDFAGIAGRLAASYRVLTPDLRGRGRSPWDPKPANYHPVTYYHDVIALLDAEVRRPAVILGTSLGGILAMSLAAMAADRIAGIVLNDIGPEVAQDGLARIGSYVGLSPPVDSWAEAAAQVRANYGAAFADFDDAQFLAYARSCYREREDGKIVPDYDPAIGDTLRAAPAMAFDMWPVWTLVRQPVIAIRGANSDILSAATFERMGRERPMSRLEVPGRGHVPLLNEPGVPEAIEQFIAQVFP